MAGSSTDFIYKLVDSSQLDSDLTTVANAIRTKGGTSEQLSFPSGMAQAIEDLPSGGLPNVRKFQVTTDSTLGTYGGISFPVIKSGRANYLIMNTDATHLNASDRHVRAIGLCIDYNYSTTKQAIGIARYDMETGGAINPSMTISDGVLTMLGGSVYHMEQTYTLDVYEVIW